MEKLLIQLFGEEVPNNTATKNEGNDDAGQNQNQQEEQQGDATKVEKTPEELAAEQKAKEEADAIAKAEKAKQDAYNKEQARLRRERERQEELAKAKLDAVKEAIGNNPYTDKPINTQEDYEEYLLMKKIDKEGGDPKADYAEYLKKTNREKYEREQKVKADKERMEKEINNFVTAHPDVNLEELLKQDGDFALFIRGKQGQTLESLYKDFTKIIGKYKSELNQKEREELAKLRASATPGSLGGGGFEVPSDLYTEAQIDAMTQKDLSDPKVLEKVNKSLDYIRKHKK